MPRGLVARSPDEAYQAAKELKSELVVVKAQIHAGGRGKGGGVKLAKTADEAREIARQMLGMKLVTHQTGPAGREVRVLLIEEGLPSAKDFNWASYWIEPLPAVVHGFGFRAACTSGGMCCRKPEQIFKATSIRPWLSPFPARKLAFALDCGALISSGKFMRRCIGLMTNGASLMEINPFLLTKIRLIALDAKVTFDYNLFSPPDFANALLNEAEPLRSKRRNTISLIKLDGTFPACDGAGACNGPMDILNWPAASRKLSRRGRGASQERVRLRFAFCSPTHTCARF